MKYDAMKRTPKNAFLSGHSSFFLQNLNVDQARLPKRIGPITLKIRKRPTFVRRYMGTTIAYITGGDVIMFHTSMLPAAQSRVLGT